MLLLVRCDPVLLLVTRTDIRMRVGPDGRSRGFGTVNFATEADAERGVRMFNGYVSHP